MRNIFDYKDNLHEMDHIPAVLKWGCLDSPKPDVSILMPVYNHPHFFRMALDTAISQDYKGNYEIVILDNNMDDDVDNINEFESYVIEKNDKRILYYKNKKNIQGINSYNRLPQLARADYFTFLHDDDELCPNCLRELMEARNYNGFTKELIVPSSLSIDKNSMITTPPKLINSRDLWGRNYRIKLFDWFNMSYTNGGGVLHHRQSFLDLGGYCHDFIPSADYAFYTLYSLKFGSYYLNKRLFRYRWAENDSMIVYEQCTQRDRQFRENMQDYIHLPNWLLRMSMDASFKLRLSNSDIRFKGKTLKPASIKDRVVARLFLAIRLIVHIF